MSLKFTESNMKIAEQVREQLSLLGIKCADVGSISKEPPQDVVRSEILACDALLAIITTERSDWVQNEIGIAWGAKKPIYALVEKGVSEVGGILEKVTSYVSFRRDSPFEIRKSIAELSDELAGKTIYVCVVEPEVLLASTTKTGTPFSIMSSFDPTPTIRDTYYEHQNRGPVTIAVRIPELPAGDLLMTVFIPPEFNLGRVTSSPDNQIVTQVPQQICRITAGRRENVPFLGFSFIKIILAFPQAQAHLRSGWLSLKLLDVTSPLMSGRYLFYGQGQVSIDSSTAATSPFVFNPIIVKGEVSPATVSGSVFTSGNKPLEYPGRVRAVGIASDPYDSTHKSTGRPVEGCFYLSLTDRGRFALNVAPGRYDIYACAIDYREVPIATNVLVTKSTTLDGSLPYEPE